MEVINEMQQRQRDVWKGEMARGTEEELEVVYFFKSKSRAVWFEIRRMS